MTHHFFSRLSRGGNVLAVTWLLACCVAAIIPATTWAQPARSNEAKPAVKAPSAARTRKPTQSTATQSRPATLTVPGAHADSNAAVVPEEPLASSQGDYIVAVVNRELISAGEVERRVAAVTQDAQRNATLHSPPTLLRQQVLDDLIDERALLTHAREAGQRIDEAELDRAMLKQAQLSQLSLAQFIERLRAQGIDTFSMRNQLRDQLLVERVRERELQSRIKISESDIEAFLAQKLGEAGSELQYNVAQVLIKVPEDATPAEQAQKRLLAEQAYARLQGGEPMLTVARDLSEDDNKDNGGALGLRPASRLPDVFLAQVSPLKVGALAPEILRTNAGWHVLQLLERRGATRVVLTQTRARHILLRPSTLLGRPAAIERLKDIKRNIEGGQQTFEQSARENSQDGSAEQGGDLGWTLQGSYVPEFESALVELEVGKLSEPVVSRFGVHLIEVLGRRQVPVEMKQLREMARNMLREQRFETAYADWQRELRGQAYIELREPPLP